MVDLLFYLSQTIPFGSYIILLSGSILLSSSIYSLMKISEDDSFRILKGLVSFSDKKGKNDSKSNDSNEKENKDEKDSNKEQDYKKKYDDYIEGIKKESADTKKTYDQLYYSIMTKLKVRNRFPKKNGLYNIIYKAYKRLSWNRMRLYLKGVQKPFKYSGISYNPTVGYSQMSLQSFFIKFLAYINREFYTSRLRRPIIPSYRKPDKRRDHKGEVDPNFVKYVEKFLDDVRIMHIKKNKKAYYFVFMFRWFIPTHTWRMLFHDPSIFGRRLGLNEVYLFPTIWENTTGNLIRSFSKWIQRWGSYTLDFFPMRVEFSSLREMYKKPWMQTVFYTLLKNRRAVFGQQRPRQRTKHIGSKKKMKKSKYRRKIRSRPKMNRMTDSIFFNYFFIPLRLSNIRRLFLSQLINFSKHPLYKSSLRYMSSDFLTLMKRYKRKSRSLMRRKVRRRKKYKRYRKKMKVFPSPLKDRQKRRIKRNLLGQSRAKEWLFKNRAANIKFNLAFKRFYFQNKKLIDSWLKKRIPLDRIRNYYNYDSWLSKVKLDLTMALIALISPSLFDKLFKNDLLLMKKYKHSFLDFLKNDPKGIQRVGQSFFFYLGPDLFQKASSRNLPFSNIKPKTHNTFRQLFINSLFKAYSLFMFNFFSKKGKNQPTTLLKSPKSRIAKHFRTLYGFMFTTSKYKSYDLNKRKVEQRLRQKLFRSPEGVFPNLKRKKKGRGRHFQYGPYQRYLKLRVMDILSNKVGSPKDWIQYIRYLSRNISHTSLTNPKKAINSIYVHLPFHLKRFYTTKGFAIINRFKGLRKFTFLVKTLRKRNRHVKRFTKVRLKPLSKEKQNYTRYSRFSSLMNKTRYSLLNNQYLLIKELFSKYIKTPSVNYHNKLLHFMNPLLIKYYRFSNIILILYGLKKPVSLENKLNLSSYIKENSFFRNLGKLFIETLINNTNFNRFFDPINKLIVKTSAILLRYICSNIAILTIAFLYLTTYITIPMKKFVFTISDFVVTSLCKNYTNIYIYMYIGSFDSFIQSFFINLFVVPTEFIFNQLMLNFNSFILNLLRISTFIYKPLYLWYRVLFIIFISNFGFIMHNNIIHRLVVFFQNSNFTRYLLSMPGYFWRRPSWDDHRILALAYYYIHKITSRGWRFLFYYIGFAYRAWFRPLYQEWRLDDLHLRSIRDMFDMTDDDWLIFFLVYRGDVILRAFFNKAVESIWSYFFGDGFIRRYFRVFKDLYLEGVFNISYYLRLIKYILLGPIAFLLDILFGIPFFIIRCVAIYSERAFLYVVRLEVQRGFIEPHETPTLNFIYAILLPSRHLYLFCRKYITDPMRKFIWDSFMEVGLVLGQFSYTLFVILSKLATILPLFLKGFLMIYTLLYSCLYFTVKYLYQSVFYMYSIINLFFPIGLIMGQYFRQFMPYRFIGGLDYVINLQEEISNMLIITVISLIVFPFIYFVYIRIPDFIWLMFRIKSFREQVLSHPFIMGDHNYDFLLDFTFRDSFESYYARFLYNKVKRLHRVYYSSAQRLWNFSYKNARTNFENYLKFRGRVSFFLKKHGNFLYKTKDHSFMKLKTGWDFSYPYFLDRSLKKTRKRGTPFSAIKLALLQQQLLVTVPIKWENKEKIEKRGKKYRISAYDQIRKAYLGESTKNKESIKVDSYYDWLMDKISKLKQKYLGGRRYYKRLAYNLLYFKQLLFNIIHVVVYGVVGVYILGLMVYLTFLLIFTTLFKFLVDLFVPRFIVKYFDSFLQKFIVENDPLKVKEYKSAHERLVRWITLLIWSATLWIAALSYEIITTLFFIGLTTNFQTRLKLRKIRREVEERERERNDSWFDIHSWIDYIHVRFLLRVQYVVTFTKSYLSNLWKYYKGDGFDRARLMNYARFYIYRPFSNDPAYEKYVFRYSRMREEFRHNGKLYRHIKADNLDD